MMDFILKIMLAFNAIVNVKPVRRFPPTALCANHTTTGIHHQIVIVKIFITIQAVIVIVAVSSALVWLVGVPVRVQTVVQLDSIRIKALFARIVTVSVQYA